MKWLYLLIAYLCFIPKVESQNRDSIIRKYFVCETTTFFKSSKIIKDGQRILVVDSANNKLRGILTIINDTLFEVHNILNHRIDTFNTKAIVKVKKPTLFGTITSITEIGIGVTCLVLGIYILSFPDGGVGAQFGGIFLTSGGLFTAVGGAFSINGKTYQPWEYKYRIIKTKGFKLRRKYIHSL